MMLGDSAIDRLHHSRVLIAGLGAVGGYVVEILARSGIGHFTLVDFDTFKPSNLNRQILALWDTMDRKKTDVARERIRSIHPSAQVQTIDLLLKEENIFTLLSEQKVDLLIDAIDSLGPKTDLLRSAVNLNIPRISSMGAALRTDPDRIRFGKLTDVTHCPLAAMLRKRLRRKGISTDEIPCVYSTEEVRSLLQDPAIKNNLSDSGSRILPPEMSDEDPRSQGRIRSVLGSLPTLTGLFGIRIAHEAIRFLASENSI